jgi:hypothetical protein
VLGWKLTTKSDDEEVIRVGLASGHPSTISNRAASLILALLSSCFALPFTWAGRQPGLRHAGLLFIAPSVALVSQSQQAPRPVQIRCSCKVTQMRLGEEGRPADQSGKRLPTPNVPAPVRTTRRPTVRATGSSSSRQDHGRTARLPRRPLGLTSDLAYPRVAPPGGPLS